MDRKLLEGFANEKIADLKLKITPLQTELDKWEKFLISVQNEDVLILESSGAPSNLPTQSAPIISNGAAPDEKIKWAEPIRNYFESHKRNFIPASQVAGAVLKELKIEKKLYNKMKPKIYSQLATFEKQKKCVSEKRGSKSYYKWTAK